MPDRSPREEASVPNDNLIRIMCPNLSCQRILAVPEQARGRIVRCRVCGMNIRIPAGKAPEAQPQKPASDEAADKASTGGRGADKGGRSGRS
jgi:ribosomal protein S27E